MTMCSNVLKALKEYPELTINFIPGQRLNQLSVLLKLKRQLSGLGAAFLFVVYFLVRYFFSRDNTKKYSNGKVDCLYYWGTGNQYASLVNVFDTASKNGVNNISLTTLKDLKVHSDIYMSLSFKDILNGIVLLTLRFKVLFKSVNEHEFSDFLKKYHFHEFLKVYFYIPYFLRVLSKLKPSLVVMSNDHNCTNRCLLLACKISNIETAYIQHANVSNVFPPLDFNYALLDGMRAVEVYEQCQEGKEINRTEIYLCGQQKKFTNISKKSNGHDVIGVAINKLDDLKVVKDVVSSIDENTVCYIRWHPAYNKNEIRTIKLLSQERKNVLFSNPKEESVDIFLNKIDVLLAGDTSLHLEAVLFGNKSCYFKFGDFNNCYDYYGFVKSGIVAEYPQSDSLFNMQLLCKTLDQFSVNFDSIRHYSETYNTKWATREDVLASEVISKIIGKGKMQDLFIEKDNDVFRTLNKLKE